MNEIIGWLAALFLGICGIPQAILAFKQKHSRGISWGLLLFWAVGEFLMFAYVLPTGKYPLILTCLINMVAVSIILYFKILDKHKEEATLGQILKKLPKTPPYYYGNSDLDNT
jgi:uncharacterized protein with PQ loop repeat